MTRAWWALAWLLFAVLMALWFAVPQVTHAQATDPRVRLGLVSPLVAEGARLFFFERFGGNGRTCGTCHPANNNLTVAPRETQLAPASYPIFAASVPGLEVLSAVRSAALILENLDGFAAPTTRFVLRSIPHTMSLGVTISAPPSSPLPGALDRTGWGGDGAPPPGQLRDFATGAVRQHFTKDLRRRVGIDFRLPTDAELVAFDAYLRSVGRLADVDLMRVTFADPAATRGRALFFGVGKCNNCHRDAGANTSFDGRNGSFNTGVQLALSFAGVPADDGAGTPGDGTFNTPSLIEAADTPPFFHTNRPDTIEQAVAFYSTPGFDNSPSGLFLRSPAGGGAPIALTTAQTLDVAALLRVLNGAYNLALAKQRWQAAVQIDLALGTSGRTVATSLLGFGGEEIVDALKVLGDRALGQVASACAIAAVQEAQLAEMQPQGALRTNHLAAALRKIAEAQAALTTGLAYELGAGNLALPLH